MTTTRIISCDAGDIDRLVEFEKQCFDPSIQASRETILQRLSLGHTVFGLDEGGLLVGAVAFSYGNFDPQDQTRFPKSENEFACQPIPASYNAAYVYSRGVHPDRREVGYSKLLVDAVLAKAKCDGCIYAVGNPRTASYAGSDPLSTHEVIAAQPRFRRAVDRYLAGGPFPTRDELVCDPALLYYSHVPGCVFHWIIPNFASHDAASGGIRIIVYVPLGNWHAR